MIALLFVVNCNRQEEGDGEENSETRKLGKLKKKSLSSRSVGNIINTYNHLSSFLEWMEHCLD